jgi:hypothetical protein
MEPDERKTQSDNCDLQSASSSEIGFIYLRARLTDGNDKLLIGLDHMYLKDGKAADSNDPSARRAGPMTVGEIKNQEVQLFDVVAGTHEIVVWNDFYGSEPLRVEVKHGETIHLICGDNFSGLKRAFYSVYYCVRPPAAGKYYYFLRKAQT